MTLGATPPGSTDLVKYVEFGSNLNIIARGSAFRQEAVLWRVSEGKGFIHVQLSVNAGQEEHMISLLQKEELPYVEVSYTDNVLPF